MGAVKIGAGANYESVCKQCGRKISVGVERYKVNFSGNDYFCSEGCCRTWESGKKGGSSSGGGKGGGLLGGIVGGIAGAATAKNDARKAAAKAEEEARAAERAAKHKDAISAIKNFQFDESDEESFNRSAIMFLDEYNTCNAGLMADNEYKKVYEKRVESEIKILKTNNPVFAEKLQNLYADAKAEMKKKLKMKLIISGVIFGIATVGGLIWGITGVSDDINAGFGLLAGAGAGLIFSAAPQMGFSNNRRENNE